MTWLIAIGFLAAGLLLLGGAGEFLVNGSSRLARQVGISPLVVGLTVVAFGTSAPEVAVTMVAAGHGSDDIAVANVVGSCIFNVLAVLGLAALTRPLKVSLSIIDQDAPIMIGALALFMLFASNHLQLERWMGGVFLGLLAAYTLLTIAQARRQGDDVQAEFAASLPKQGSLWVSLLLIVLGLVGLVIGGDLVVRGAVQIAQLIGISERIIGLTIVSVGTSLPEVAACVIAARRNQPDIAIGNIIGSNIFNIFAVLGCTTSFFSLSVNQATLFFDGMVMLAASVLVYPIMRTGRSISRGEGTVLLVLYVVYLIAVVLTDRPAEL